MTGTDDMRPARSDELPYLLSIRMAVEGREWNETVERGVLRCLRTFAMARRRKMTGTDDTRPARSYELPHLLSIRMAVEGRKWDETVERAVLRCLRTFAMARQRKRKTDWAREKHRQKRLERSGGAGG